MTDGIHHSRRQVCTLWVVRDANRTSWCAEDLYKSWQRYLCLSWNHLLSFIPIFSFTVGTGWALETFVSTLMQELEGNGKPQDIQTNVQTFIYILIYRLRRKRCRKLVRLVLYYYYYHSTSKPLKTVQAHPEIFKQRTTNLQAREYLLKVRSSQQPPKVLISSSFKPSTYCDPLPSEIVHD